MLVFARRYPDLLDTRTGTSNVGRALWQRPTPLLPFPLLFVLLMWFDEHVIWFNVMSAFLYASRCHVLDNVIFRHDFLSLSSR